MLVIVYFVLLIVQPIKLVASSFGDFISFTSTNTNTTNSSGQIASSGNVTWNVNKKLSYVDLYSTRQTSNKTIVPYPNWYFGFKLNKDYDPTYLFLGLYQAVYDGKGYYYGGISFDKCTNSTIFPEYDNLTSFYCPNATDVAMHYEYANGYYQTVSMDIRK